MKDKAKLFGAALDKDDFELAKTTLADNCCYYIGEEMLHGPDAICQSYEDNMIAGRKKLEKLVWGKSRIEVISETEFFVHFTDYLTHRGIEHTHTCKQKLKFNADGEIERIEHIEDAKAQSNLDDYYRSVGLR